jgi:hypothetical protein
MKFRQYPVAVMADVQEMFSQIKIKTEDQQSQRILWRDDETHQIKVMIMQAMTFGASCSPACAQAVKNVNARKFADRYPDAVDAIVNRMYVDDYLNSHASVEEAVSLAQDVIKINKDAGFKLRNFVSNSKEFMAAISNDNAKSTFLVNMNEGNELTEKALGLYWDVKMDSFTFKVAIIESQEPATKRSILRIVMRVFDILGFVAHIIIRAKIIIQKIWRAGTDWDEPVNEELKTEWNQWLKSLSKLQNFSVPRSYTTSPVTGACIQLHVFVDASEEAFATVAYFRFLMEKLRQHWWELNRR